MFVQQLSLRVHPDAIPQLRQLVQSQYMPRLKQHIGFVAAHLVAHIDHQDTAELIIYWENEQAMRIAAIQGHNLPDVPGLQIAHQSYAAASQA